MYTDMTEGSIKVHLSRAMAVMLRVETNTETEVTKGKILQRSGSCLHDQKLSLKKYKVGKPLVANLKIYLISFKVCFAQFD